MTAAQTNSRRSTQLHIPPSARHDEMPTPMLPACDLPTSEPGHGGGASDVVTIQIDGCEIEPEPQPKKEGSTVGSPLSFLSRWLRRSPEEPTSKASNRAGPGPAAAAPPQPPPNAASTHSSPPKSKGVADRRPTPGLKPVGVGGTAGAAHSSVPSKNYNPFLPTVAEAAPSHCRQQLKSAPRRHRRRTESVSRVARRWNISYADAKEICDAFETVQGALRADGDEDAEDALVLDSRRRRRTNSVERVARRWRIPFKDAAEMCDNVENGGVADTPSVKLPPIQPAKHTAQPRPLFNVVEE
mmetsp:Transcript_11430/g.29169  ORF Transcript_11430/g.29169 Transcript_11430/m.29169 type:complete len:299 (-) Transcript_11430:153-1049(-)|eukprot:CAMPEP_0182924924 /NCGR_PEP_ID=MMETSP0105_2-20130417/8033_1 /TAXON_ID=81532 ORGANISM="Acanthoeca-like sp., Strain 10tr" /NCGR_SAMPLE_ID=MMETSP0105_2 /ASSEMBLY_ACC=CAM_ASM_000205 /LENGTH=298 /DNA_ID=CAMNT_0025062745 /DNA_START=175 /DNA_END=1071 /DNA_ORIENTATION=+